MVAILFKESIELIIFMLAGFLLVKLNGLKQMHISGLSSVLTNLALPCAILMSCQIPFSWSIVNIIIQSMIVSLLFMLITLFIAIGVTKLFKVKISLQSVWIGCCTFSNILFIGIPIIGSIFGERGLIALVTYNAVSNVFLFTFGIKLYSGKSHFDFRSFLFTSAIAASIIGFVFFFTKITIPKPFAEALTSLGGMTAPLSMVITGALFAFTDMKRLLKRIDIYNFCLTRLIILPILLIPLLKLGVPNTIILGVMIIAAAMPAGAINTAMAELYAGEGRTASEYVVVSTLISMVTIPIITYLALS
ncbi:AEC family transporter [Sporolactobacillus kofuensis]|uniref:AEC family transporter n=1 Tax=Sporolactobacillus kofuensis TaxID=269672 RepID=A0ABW1WGU2_9BACL|nr:AEC family transporter [Sporolactobacillus kofuensis]MCO7175741.1 AEC family transporter [Sporolactobacillus kofuensis]